MTIVTAITEVFSAIGEWIIEALQSALTLFWGSEGLTILGTLAVMALAVSVFLLLIGIIQNFLHFRS